MIHWLFALIIIILASGCSSGKNERQSPSEKVEYNEGMSNLQIPEVNVYQDAESRSCSKNTEPSFKPYLATWQGESAFRQMGFSGMIRNICGCLVFQSTPSSEPALVLMADWAHVYPDHARGGWMIAADPEARYTIPLDTYGAFWGGSEGDTLNLNSLREQVPERCQHFSKVVGIGGYEGSDAIH